MADNNDDNSNAFLNAFYGKSNGNQDPKTTDPAEVLDDGKDNAIQNLIFHSFYPATCMVPLDENLITISETVPDLMKAKNHDPILQETIKTFHSLMKEKDDEIFNLRRQINPNDSTNNMVEMKSGCVQTDLTLEECTQMEQQIGLLTKDIPEKNERIHQLQQEIVKHQESMKILNDEIMELKKKPSVLKASDSKIDDLEDAYKSLMEVEEKNVALLKQVEEITDKYQKLQYQFEDIKDLKVEIEEAKVQAENDLHSLEKTLENKTVEIQQLKSIGNKVGVFNDQTDMISALEWKTLQRKYENQIEELRKCLTTARGENSTSPSNLLEVDDVICELKKKIYNESSSSQILPHIPENLVRENSFQHSSDKEIVCHLVTICCNDEASEAELMDLVPILSSISFNENGSIIVDNTGNKVAKCKDACRKWKKDQLIQEAINKGLQLNMMENLSYLEVDDLKREYMKLENILNIMNNHFKLTPLGILNRMSRDDLCVAIMEKRAIVFDICMHGFWNVFSNAKINDNDLKKQIKLSKLDTKLVCDVLFGRIKNEENCRDLISVLTNVRNILLYGELSEGIKADSAIFLMKLHSSNMLHDIINHILPKYPREIRSRLMEITIEDSIIESFKVHENISPEFMSVISLSHPSPGQIDTTNLAHMQGFSWVFLDLISLLNFEEDLFVVLTSSQKNELPASVLSMSNTTKKIEKSLIKVGFQKNIKEKLLAKLLKLQFILNKNEIRQLTETCKSKSEMELSKLLIKKKENILKLIFKDNFSPPIEKLPVPRGARLLSCVSKERINVDFWLKLILDKYYKQQGKEVQGLTEDELQVCLKRLMKVKELLCPNMVVKVEDNKPGKTSVIKLIFIYRFLLIRKLQESLIENHFNFQLTEDIDDELKNYDTIDVQPKDQFEELKLYFETPLTHLDLSDLHDILKRLYDIDCEIFPGLPAQDINLKEFEKIKSDVILEEIIYMRLAIASSMIFKTVSLEDVKPSADSDVDKWAVMKKLESLIVSSDLVEVDRDLVDSERDFLGKILKKCKLIDKISEENLKKMFINVKQLSCRNTGETFEMADVIKSFNRVHTKEGKVDMVCKEAENIINGFKRKLSPNDDGKTLMDNYMKLESLLEIMESSFSIKNKNYENTWIYSLYDKVREIRSHISNDLKDIQLDKDSLRGVVINYLDDIRHWIISSHKLQATSFIRLSNAIRKLNNLGFLSERKVKMSTTEIDFNPERFDQEKLAFEKAFTELEERINEIDLKKQANQNYAKVIDVGLKDKTDEDLRNLILSLENELAETKLGRTEIKETKLWLSERSRPQLEEDCRTLTHKMLMKKLEDFLYEEEEFISKSHGTRPDNLSQFEDDINLKLLRYQELCDTVERLKIPQLYSKSKLSPTETHPLYRDTLSGIIPQDLKSKQDLIQSQKSRAYLNGNEEDDIDIYFRKRLSDLQNSVHSSMKSNLNSKDSAMSARHHHGSDVLVDGFEIEDEKTPRYYSMKLQDIQHDRKADEMGTMLYQMEQERVDLLEQNKNLQQQVFLSNNLIENQERKLEALEKSDKILRQRITAIESNEKQDYDSKSRFEDVRILKNEINQLSSSLLVAQQKLDQQNSNFIELTALNNNLQHADNNLAIKIQYLLRSLQKLEEEYKDLVQQLEHSRSSLTKDRNDSSQIVRDFSRDSDLERRLRQSENDKKELVKKLDIIAEQNELLKEHCEKLDNELSAATKSLAISQSTAENYRQQVKQLADVLDGIKSEHERYPSFSDNSLSKTKDEELKRLRKKVLHLENKLISFNQV